MKKETVVAVILGIAAGLGVAVIMIGKAREGQMMSSKSISTSIQVSPTVSLKNKQFQSLEITEPEIGSIQSGKTVTIKGKASIGALLIVQSVIKNVAIKLDKTDFTILDFPISLGENTIRVTVYPKDSQIPPQEKELKVYYLDEQ